MHAVPHPHVFRLRDIEVALTEERRKVITVYAETCIFLMLIRSQAFSR
ncbi:protein of unknown function [Pseudomonas sp. JV551A1]|uniref:Uncharacterized protein n=1 Tax=Pseudomonas inefficax TaxID=2078786 RepID=A0AAQ1P7Q0_9PSED|nr:protein of unknown function [Pseudomonas sp. JV551A1]SPO59345.1 protein of unknown function [Pseudomonas inefficax]